MADEERFVLTRGGYQRLMQEMERAKEKQAEQRSLLNDLDEERTDPDGDEEGAYFEMVTTLEHANERIGNIEYVLQRAEIREEDPDPKRVNVGERVTVWDFADKRERLWDIVSSPEIRVSYDREDGGYDIAEDSPVGAALLGKAVGDVVEVETPDGSSRYALRKIETIPE